MSLPESFRGLRLPLIAAPMFLVSGEQLVIAAGKNGIVGAFPALNQRTTEGFRQWVQAIKAAGLKVPFGVNLIVHKSNPRLEADLQVCVEEQVPLVITSLGAVTEIVNKIHSYGGIVFHDITNLRHAQKANEAGVDGLIAVAAGAGGHAGQINPFALVGMIRQFFSKTVILAGAMSSGRDILAARALGADLAYMGTRFIATQESRAQAEYKQMVVGSVTEDIVYTPAVSGVPASFMRASLERAGITDFNKRGEMDFGSKNSAHDEAKLWRDIWSAGQGVGNITDVPSVADLVQRLEREYKLAQKEILEGSSS